MYVMPPSPGPYFWYFILGVCVLPLGQACAFVCRVCLSACASVCLGQACAFVCLRVHHCSPSIRVRVYGHM
jgi:hypothetical protein